MKMTTNPRTGAPIEAPTRVALAGRLTTFHAPLLPCLSPGGNPGPRTWFCSERCGGVVETKISTALQPNNTVAASAIRNVLCITSIASSLALARVYTYFILFVNRWCIALRWYKVQKRVPLHFSFLRVTKIITKNQKQKSRHSSFASGSSSKSLSASIAAVRRALRRVYHRAVRGAMAAWFPIPDMRFV